MNRNYIRRIFITFLLLITFGVYVYTAYFIPDHRSPDGMTDYGLNHTVIYTPVLFMISGVVIGFFLKLGECKVYAASVYGVLLATMFIFRCVNAPFTLQELPKVLFAHVVYVLFITVIHLAAVLLVRAVSFIISRFIKGKMS